MTKSKAMVYWQHFGLDGQLEGETTTTQNVYHRKNGTYYVNYLGGTRSVMLENDRYIAFGSKKATSRTLANLFKTIQGDLK